MVSDVIKRIFSKKSPIAYFEFSYNSVVFNWMKSLVDAKKEYSVNIGDYIQSEIVHRLLENLKVLNITTIDRDSIKNYKGIKKKVFCNAILYDITVPQEPLEPIFLGTSLCDSPEAVDENYEIFKKFSPIGCRDEYSCNLLKEKGIDAFISFCYSMTLPKRKVVPKRKKIFFVGISDGFRECIPKELLPYSEFIIQRKYFNKYPLSKSDIKLLKKDAINLIKRYKKEATLVVSPLLHCISPCIGLGIPVILARDSYNERFSSIKKITKLYTKENWKDIDWDPSPIDVEDLKVVMRRVANCKINDDKVDREDLNFLNNYMKGV